MLELAGMSSLAGPSLQEPFPPCQYKAKYQRQGNHKFLPLSSTVTAQNSLCTSLHLAPNPAHVLSCSGGFWAPHRVRACARGCVGTTPPRSLALQEAFSK